MNHSHHRVLIAVDLARRGLLPQAKLRSVVDPRVLDQFGSIAPPAAGAPIGPARIGGLRVQMTTDRHAHVAAVAHTPGRETAGYVFELRRDGAARPWVVTELSRVQDRHLVGPHTPEDTTERRTRGLPANLTGLIRATQHARDQAAAALACAERQQAALGDRPRNTQRLRDELPRDTHRSRVPSRNGGTASTTSMRNWRSCTKPPP